MGARDAGPAGFAEPRHFFRSLILSDRSRTASPCLCGSTQAFGHVCRPEGNQHGAAQEQYWEPRVNNPCLMSRRLPVKREYSEYPALFGNLGSSPLFTRLIQLGRRRVEAYTPKTRLRTAGRIRRKKVVPTPRFEFGVSKSAQDAKQALRAGDAAEAERRSAGGAGISGSSIDRIQRAQNPKNGEEELVS